MAHLFRPLVVLIPLLFLATHAHAQWSIYLDGAAGEMYVAGDSAIVQGGAHRFFVTTDDGGTWTEVTPDWHGSNQLRGAVRFGDRFYIYGTVGNKSFLRSTTSLENWEIVPGLVNTQGDGVGLSTLLVHGDVMWVRTFPGADPYGRIYTSTNGEDWTFVTVAESHGNYMFYNDKLYARTGTTLLASSDYGATWDVVGQIDLGPVRELLPANERIYAHIRPEIDLQVLYVSDDHGATWSELRSFNAHPHEFQVRVFDGDKVAIFWQASGTQFVGISTDHGASWNEFEAPVLGLGYAYEEHVYVGRVFGARVVHRALVGDLVNVENGAPSMVGTLHPPYPNPFSTTAVIGYELEQATHADIRVYDMLGREVALLLTGIQPAGRSQVTFDSANLSTGTYFVRLTIDGESTARKVFVVR